MKTFTFFATTPFLTTMLLTFNSLLITPCTAQSPIFYGMTYRGGTHGEGAIIMFNPSTGIESVVHNFAGDTSDGSRPYGDLVFYSKNALFYAMTNGGGNSNSGVVISFNPTDNAEEVVFNLGDSSGLNPKGNLIYDTSSGTFLGLTAAGGAFSEGTIIGFGPPDYGGLEYSFGLILYSGEFPSGNLVYDDSSQWYYGLTKDGGAYSAGAMFIFKTYPDVADVIYSFGNYADGYYPEGSLSYNPGTKSFYGTTSGGGTTPTAGTIFSYNPDLNYYNLVHNFAGPPSDGAKPYGNLVLNPGNGSLYGMTSAGGTNNMGTIINLNPSTGAESVVWSFGTTTNDGEVPYGSLVYDASNQLFYGMTYGGGKNDSGTIFSFNPSNNSENVLWSFGAGQDGSKPWGDLVPYNGTTGINTIGKPSASINIYPNPINSAFNITGLSNGQIIELYNYLGQLVIKMVVDNTIQQTDISSQPNGVYLVRILNTDGSIAGQKEIVKAN